MPYRDDLEAAHIRINELEAELQDANKRSDALRHELVSQGRRRPWGWLAVGGIATLVLVGAGAGQVLYAQEREERYTAGRVASLEEELRITEMEAADAKEDSRLAFEMMSQANTERQKRAAQVGETPPNVEMKQAVEAATDDPFGESPTHTTFLYVTTDRPARIGVDGSAVYEWTPARVPINPGQHHISIIANDGRVRRNTITAHKGQTTNLAVRFDR